MKFESFANRAVFDRCAEARLPSCLGKNRTRTRLNACLFSFFSRKRIQKDNITFHPNFTVSYKEYRQYHFEPSMSVGNESDVVMIPNMLVLVRLLFSPG